MAHKSALTNTDSTLNFDMNFYFLFSHIVSPPLLIGGLIMAKYIITI